MQRQAAPMSRPPARVTSRWPAWPNCSSRWHPGNEIFRVADIALKAADVRPALQVVEREFGLLEIHSAQQAEVLAAGDAVLPTSDSPRRIG